MHTLEACPLCKSNTLKPHLSCKDFTVSHETFQIQKCTTCGMMMTNPRPDESELPAYYESEQYISHSDRSTSIVDSAYKVARHFTLKWKYDIVTRNTPVRPSTILDYGCGTGAFLNTCKENGLTVTGIEPSPKARQVAIQLIGNHVFTDTKALTGPFDVITLWHVLEHVPDLHHTINDVARLLTAEGRIFIAVPNPESLDAKHYKTHWAAYDVPRHLWHFTQDTMKKLITDHNLKIQDIVPMKLDAYYVSLLSEKYMTGKNNLSNMAQALRTAWNSNHSAKHTTNYSSLIYIIRK